jgi:hypothetical protein
MRAMKAVRRSLAVLLSMAQAAIGCGPATVMVPRHDRELPGQLAKAAQVRAEVERLAPAAPEVPLYMMAESLYRYRFELPRRSLGVYIAQAAAVAVELPALQAVAGSMDLFHLRLKTADGAVQLWETLLDWYPRTALRPLVLYRLGWAYRNTAVGGLPRESGDEAFDLLMRESPGTPLATLAARARLIPWKSTDAATAWSLVPGLGQMYVGEYLNGTVRLLVGLGAAAMIVVPAILAYNRRDDLAWRNDWPLLATAFGGLILLSVSYTLAYEDAIRGVVQWNEREENRFQSEHPEAP